MPFMKLFVVGVVVVVWEMYSLWVLLASMAKIYSRPTVL